MFFNFAETALSDGLLGFPIRAEDLPLQVAHGGVGGQGFAVGGGGLRFVEDGAVLAGAEAAVGAAGAAAEGGVGEAVFRRRAQKGDVAVVVEQGGKFAGVGEDEVLHGEFDVDNAAACVFDVVILRRMGGGDFFAHGEDVVFEGGAVARQGEDIAADAFEGRLNGGFAADEAGAGEGLVLPRPGVAALVFFKGGEAVDDEAAVAVGAQAQVGLVERARAGGGGARRA